MLIKSNILDCFKIMLLVFIAVFPTHSLSQTAYEEQVQKMYTAYYGRPADPGGLSYWVGKIESNGGDLGEVIDSFGNSQEYTDRFGSYSSVELVNNIYTQLLGRDADTAGLNWYIQKLESGSSDWSLASIALRVMDGVQEGDDASIVANRLQIANAFTTSVSNGENSYESLQDIPAAVSLLENVTKNTNTVSHAIAVIADSAVPIPADSNIFFTQSFVAAGESDFYTFDKDAGSTVMVTLSGFTSNVDLTVDGPLSSSVFPCWSKNIGLKPEYCTGELDPSGTLTIEVTEYDGVGSTYNLTVSTFPPDQGETDPDGGSGDSGSSTGGTGLSYTGLTSEASFSSPNQALEVEALVVSVMPAAGLTGLGLFNLADGERRTARNDGSGFDGAIGARFNDNGNCQGSGSYSYNLEKYSSTLLSGTATLSNCRHGSVDLVSAGSLDVTINAVSESDEMTLDLAVTNLSLTYAGKNIRFDGGITCDDNFGRYCTISGLFQVDGKVHRVNGMEYRSDSLESSFSSQWDYEILGDRDAVTVGNDFPAINGLPVGFWHPDYGHYFADSYGERVLVDTNISDYAPIGGLLLVQETTDINDSDGNGSFTEILWAVIYGYEQSQPRIKLQKIVLGISGEITYDTIDRGESVKEP